MPTPTSRTAYRVYYEVLDRALDSPAGIRVEVSSSGEAYQYRVKLNSARSLDRELNREGRESSDPNYGISDYDHLIVRIRPADGKWWVYIEPSAVPSNIEELSNESHPHGADETPREVHVRDLRGGVQPKPRVLDNLGILPLQHRPNRNT